MPIYVISILGVLSTRKSTTIYETLTFAHTVPRSSKKCTFCKIRKQASKRQKSCDNSLKIRFEAYQLK